LIHTFTFFVAWHIHGHIPVWDRTLDTFSKWIIHVCSMMCILRVYLVKACTYPYLCTYVFAHLYLERDINVYKHDKTSQSICVAWWFMYAFKFVAWKMIKSFLRATGLDSYTWQRIIDMWYVIHAQDTLTVFVNSYVVSI